MNNSIEVRIRKVGNLNGGGGVKFDRAKVDFGDTRWDLRVGDGEVDSLDFSKEDAS